ncbi:MAG: hypothetical protein KDC48_17750 [Planctomycetes bacterium]|nr:hypothetical protein [Planctomycetota bacterium]
MTLHTLLVLHAAPTLLLTGLIWVVQIAHYPSFADIGAADFVTYERRYTARVGRVVLPLMLAELMLTGWLWWAAPPELAPWPLVGAALLAVVWASTFLLQVPCHTILSQRADRDAMRRLVRGNWLRTVAWTLRAAIAVALLLGS